MTEIKQVLKEVHILANNGIRKKFTKQKRMEVYKKYNKKCSYCGADLLFNCETGLLLKKKNMTIDHIIPLKKGGSNGFNNIRLSCSSCNQWKSGNTTEHFRKKIAGTLDILVRYKNIRHQNTATQKIPDEIIKKAFKKASDIAISHKDTLRNLVIHKLISGYPHNITFYYEMNSDGK